MKRLFFSLAALLCTVLLVAQVTTSPNPIPVGYTGEVIITFDPAGGNGGMVGATKCYAHTGLITSASSSDSDWKNVVGSGWRKADSPQLTATDDGKWQLTMTSIYDFYGVSESTQIKKLAFVFHDGPGGSKEGKTSSGGDIFITLGEETVSSIWDAVEGVVAVNKARPTGISNGIYYGADGTSVTLCTYAASKTESAKRVFLLGDMTNWRLDADHQLYKDGNYFWITLTGLTKGKEYRFQYAVERADGVKKQISDLYSEKVIHPDDKYEPRTVDPKLINYPTRGADGGYVTVIQPGKTAYNWSDATLNFQRPDKNNLVIYELWVYDFTTDRSLKGLMTRLDYLKTLGVNAVELMPVCEFDGNYNWGYSPNHYFAFDRAYGSSDMFKEFIDECHKRGMAVIMDMVFNHATGNNPMNKLYPYGDDLAKNPWFNVSAPHSDNVYEDWNHGFAPAHEMFTRALKYWLQEYKVDGFRMDLSHGFCSDQPNTSVGNLKDYYTNGVQAGSPGAYFILEHWGSNMSSERPQLISAGMQCWANTTNAYCQAAMGWLKDGDSFAEANKDGYVSYAESHDEERMQYKAKKWGDGDLTTNEAARLARVPVCVAFNAFLNGSHMLWQFEEVGYDFSINSDIDHPNGDNESYRCNKKPRPEAKGYFSDPNRQAAYIKTAQALQLRTRLMPSVFEGNPTSVSIATGNKLRKIQWGSNVFVAGNFSATTAQSVTIPSGTWYNYYLQSKQTASTVELQPGELLILTGTQQQLPVIGDVEKLSTGIEDVVITSMPNTQVQKFFYNGTLYIRRGNRTYTVDGQLVQ